jgi:periplasmic protein TonB
MVIRQALPFDFAPRGRRTPAKTTLIVAASLGVHAAVAGYLAMMQFAPPKAPPTLPERPWDVEIYTPPKPQPPDPDTKPQPQQVKFNQVLPPTAPTPVVDPIRIDPPDEPVRTIGPLASLTTGPVAPPSPPDPIIRNPTWLKMPGANEFARFYPDAEIRREIEGRAVLNCQVTAKGSLTACRVASLTPAGSGFGEAALKLSRYFVMSPRTVDGQAVEGGQVSIPITFNLD